MTFDNASAAAGRSRPARSRSSATCPGSTCETFRTIAEDAKENCPISIALKGNVELVVDASLVTEA